MKRLSMAVMIVGIVLVGGTVRGEKITPRPMGFSQLEESEGYKPTGKSISALEYANKLASEGRIERNPIKLGLASLSYFAMSLEKPDLRQYAVDLLELATRIAQEENYVGALRWLAEIWRSNTLGAGDPERADQVLKVAEKLKGQPNATMGFGEKGAPGLLPSYYK